MRHHYFDDVKVGDSTARFLDAVAELVALRDTLLQGGAEQAIATWVSGRGRAAPAGWRAGRASR